jgi:hypothetical protein
VWRRGLRDLAVGGGHFDTIGGHVRFRGSDSRFGHEAVGGARVRTSAAGVAETVANFRGWVRD